MYKFRPNNVQMVLEEEGGRNATRQIISLHFYSDSKSLKLCRTKFYDLEPRENNDHGLLNAAMV